MRILYHHRTQSEDAQGIHINEMVKAFRDLGHEVELVSLVESQGESGKKTRGGAWQWLVNLAPSWLYELLSLTYNLYGYRCLAQAMRRKRADLIYERYSLNTFCGIWVGRRFGVPLVLEVNAPLAHEQEKLGKLAFKKFARFSERWICSHSTQTMVVSEAMGKILQKEGVPKDNLAVMPNGIDPQKFHPNISGEMLRRKYGLEDKRVIGFVGWFRKWHGLEMLLEIMHESRLSEKGVRLLLVGDGPAYADLYSYAQSHELLSSVIFTGPVQRHEIPLHIATMDIAVQPKANEYACPMKIFEYMGMGKCIVAPDQPNIREILCDRINAYLFQPGDKNSLRQALLEMLDDSSRRIVVGKKACAAIFERGFLWQTNAERALRLIFASPHES
jgi:glycosyltransferase involved in cell wall biosynthesis